ncbi:type I DNA topoisomerase [Balneola vulgaris]|jgi:DNA topoisomerase-1|uniref:type I DNA topoisomerase n=1 Tax=Balneola vulgaris TaxID=287535 RepID=UPI0003670BC6|nr:type I DNA topoisomerase [Balneola vulgaris]
MKSLVIVESPTKTKTISKYLPKGYDVDSSMGHIRDLPSSAKLIPAKYKKESWATLGINPDDRYFAIYVTPPDKKKIVKRLKDKLKDVDELILATDEDREGEAISWHLLEVLKPKVPVKRMVFREITKEAIQNALENTREIDMRLVHAQETRRILDRLAGYTVSPLLWKKISPGLSAGRVQSVAVELLVERERERMKFRSGTYYDLSAALQKAGENDEFNADLTHLDGKRLASGKDFDESTGKLKKPDSVVLLDEAKAKDLVDQLKKADWAVTDVDVKIQKRNPAPPFITSTLQQEANRKFNFSARDTMSVAQKLYEKGFITYMRTDSTRLSSQAIDAARDGIVDQYGEEYLFERVRNYTKKGKTAQEAHEAIRPSGSKFILPEKSGLKDREFKLYDLIWKRTIATQMAEAELEFTNVTINASNDGTSADFRAGGKKILFPGFFRAYVEGSDDPDAALENQEKFLPAMKKGDATDLQDLKFNAHQTKPPARFTEATLVKELEKRGIGRPSTYATVISTIQDRGYAKNEGKMLIPSFTAFAVTSLLEEHFPDLVDSEFTSSLEDKLDEVAQGKQDPVKYLDDYYKGENGLRAKVDRQEDKIDAQKAKLLDLPLEGLEGIQVAVGRFGPYAKMMKDGEEVSTSLPQDMDPSDISAEKLEQLIKISEEQDKPIGVHPEEGLPVFLLSGRFGPYVQLGEVTEENKKPKRVSLLKGMTPEDVDLDLAIKLLELPRHLGEHPEDGKVVKAGVGRYGPYVVHDGKFKSLPKDDNVLTIELDRAVELLKMKAAPRKSAELKDLGKHPETEQPIKVMNGRYGPYIKHGKKNIGLPKGTEPEKFTLEEAVELIASKS